MEHPRDRGLQGQWRLATPSKPAPMKRPRSILSPNRLESLDVNGAINGQMGELEFDNDELAQMPYSSLLAINDPTIVSKLNLPNLAVAQGGGSGVGGSQRSNAELSNRNPMLVNGRIVLPSYRGGTGNQLLPSSRGDVNHRFPPLNRGDVNAQFLQLNREDVYRRSVPFTREEISRQFLPTKWEDVNCRFLQRNHAHVDGRALPPLAPKLHPKPSVPFLPNLNSLPEYNVASIFVDETMASPATPATMERIDNHLPHEIIDLDSEETSTYRSGKLPQSVANNLMEKCFSNGVKPSQIIPSQYQECERNEAVNSFEEFGVQQNVEVNSSEELDVEHTEGGNQDIDLNGTPQQKPKRKKHRPKVIREGKSMRTPKVATPKPPSTAGNPSEKRKYVRRSMKVVNPREKPSTTSEVAGDPNSQSRRYMPVRRSLNFDLEDCQARNDCLSGSGSIMFRQNVYETQIQEARVVAETVDTHTTPAVQSPLRKDPVVLKSSMGSDVGFDLSSSTNHFADEDVRIPHTPIQPPQPTRQEMLKAQWRDDFARMMSKMTQSLQSMKTDGEKENLQRLARMINLQKIQGRRERRLEASRRSQNVLLQGSKRDYNLVGSAQVQVNKSSVHSNNGACNVSENYDNVQKRRRIENAFMRACTSNGWKLTSSMQNTNKAFTFADAQRFIAHEKGPSQNRMLLLNQVARAAKNWQVQANSQISHGNVVDINKVTTPKQDCKRPSTPEKSPIYSNLYEKDGICGSKARLEFLLANQTKSKTSRQKKEEPHVNSMATNVSQMKHTTTICKIGTSLIPESEAQCSLKNNNALGALESHGDPIEDLVQKLRHLNINVGHGHKGVTGQPGNTLVPYVGRGGTMVPFEGPFELLKKRKPRPKVDLDPESDRVWNLLMGKETGAEGGTDADKERWWEEERRVFRGRADSFIARMHLIQGDRRFSRWKGSVVDSVIGVFLTQNVSDHLSSSAFMSLAARFPAKSKGNNMNANVETIRIPIIVSEPEFCDQSSLGLNETKDMDRIKESLESNIDSSKESSLDFHEIGQKSPDSVLGTAVTVTSCASAIEREDIRSFEDVISSQYSGDASQNFSECLDQTILLNFEADELLNGGRGHGFNSFTELLQMANNRVLQDPKITNNGRVPLEECSDGIDFLYASNAHFNLSGDPSRSYNHRNSLNSRFESTENGIAVINESNQSYLSPTDSFGLNETSINGSSTNAMHRNKPLNSKIAPSVDPRRQISKNTALQSDKHSCCQSEVSLHKNVSSMCLNQQGGNAITFQHRGRESDAQTERTQKPVATPQTCSISHNDSQRNNLVSINGAELNLRNEVQASQKVSHETLTDASMGKKVKAETDKKMTFDWDRLRKEVCQCSAKKERNTDAMDSLDYEAVRQADMNEISHTIRERGMNNLLAERIKDFLNRLVRDHGSIDLEWLRDIPPDKAKDYLLSIRGLGLKSVECVRLLTLHHLAFPVDTNVGRICVRLGWVPLQPLPESLQLHLLEMYPILETIQKYLWPRLCKLDQLTLYELHYQLITFGFLYKKQAKLQFMPYERRVQTLCKCIC